MDDTSTVFKVHRNIVNINNSSTKNVILSIVIANQSADLQPNYVWLTVKENKKKRRENTHKKVIVQKVLPTLLNS